MKISEMKLNITQMRVIKRIIESPKDITGMNQREVVQLGKLMKLDVVRKSGYVYQLNPLASNELRKLVYENYESL